MSEIGETTTVQWDSALEAIERCYELGWTDGLPVVPPTEARVAEFIERSGRPSGEVIGELPRAAPGDHRRQGCSKRSDGRLLARVHAGRADGHRGHARPGLQSGRPLFQHGRLGES